MEDDWVSIIWPKIDYLTQLGLEPWYLALQDALEPAILQGLNSTLFDDVSANPPRPAFYIPGGAPHTPEHLPAAGVLGCFAHSWLLVAAVELCHLAGAAALPWPAGLQTREPFHHAVAHHHQDKLTPPVLRRSHRLQPAVATPAGAAPYCSSLLGFRADQPSPFHGPSSPRQNHPACAGAGPCSHSHQTWGASTWSECTLGPLEINWLPAETPAPPVCSDNPPDHVYTCAQQQEFGKCSIGALSLC